MLTEIREKGRHALDNVPDEHMPTVVRWLELLALTKQHPDAEPEELWLLASGELEKMADEAENDAKPIGDWQK
jgi:hypothetical protein